jgi:FAD/FMN-containing dehydrogenase
MVIATSQQIQTSSKTAGAPDLDVLRARIAGDVLVAGEAYDEARKVHDVTRNAFPHAIVRATSTDDVAEAVRFARVYGRPFSVRSGGHSLGGHNIVDGAITIDLSQMKAVTIDPVRRTARVQPGTTSGDLAGPAHAYGLALSTGDVSSVGIGGLATGGGIGYMARKYGLTIDNLLSATVVTAQGDVINASPDENTDLFWAIRGGGGNFGIITEFEFQLAPVGQILGGALVLPATREVLRGYLEFMDSAPDDLTTIVNVMHAPPAPFIPADRVGELVAMVLVVWTGDIEEGQRVLQPLRQLAEPVADAVAPMPYPVIYNFTDAAAQPHAAIVRSMFANEHSDETLDAIIDAMDKATSPITMVQFRAMGGAVARVSNDATAFAHRDHKYFTSVIALWEDADEDRTPHEEWTAALWDAIKHETTGVYVNFLGDEGAERIRQAYPAATMQRLVEVKRAYDPANVFRFNQNIRP